VCTKQFKKKEKKRGCHLNFICFIDNLFIKILFVEPKNYKNHKRKF
jgi:hypothetical protein